MESLSDTVPTPFRSRAGSWIHRVKSLLLYLWDVYSAPTPAAPDVPTLLALCFTLASVTAGLLHHWLFRTLEYEGEASARTACVYGAAVLLLTAVCHPLRCVLTLTLPTVCTQQGRRLLLSAAVAILVVNVVPNVAVNVGAVTHVLKCTAEGFARTLLNSSEPLNRARHDLVQEAMTVKGDDLSVVAHLRNLEQFTRVDVTEVRRTFQKLIGQMEVDFSSIRDRIKDGRLVSNRILAAIFVALLILESSRYLKSYLTSVRFDNGHFSKKLRLEKALPACGGEKLKLPSCEISSRECTSCFVSLLLVTLYFAAIALVVALDYVVYHVVQVTLPWLLDFSSTSAVISVDYQVQWSAYAFRLLPQSCVKRSLVNFHQDYAWTFSPELLPCHASTSSTSRTSAPSPGVALLLLALWLTACSLAFLELYARRLRRRISASFFREQEQRRKTYARKKIQDEERRKTYTLREEEEESRKTLVV